MKLRFLIFPVLILLAPLLFNVESEFELQDDYSVAKVLEKLGDDSGWYPNKDIVGASSSIGREIFHTGFATNLKGKTQRKQSKHFVCTSCHNVEREDYDLTVSDPEARMKYALANDLPFLQGTTMYGAVSRRYFYNDDYIKKYGDLVEAARNDLRGAIQLCAVECAQGRKLKDWELESVLMYLWTIDIKIGDLDLSADEKEFVENSVQSESTFEAVELIRSKYLNGSPATFLTPDNERAEYSSMDTDIDSGRDVYIQSCLHCHDNQRYSYFNLDTTRLTMKHLKTKMETYGDHSIYQAVRYGIYSTAGRRSYMPHYTLEKMSKQQLADLRAYISYRAD